MKTVFVLLAVSWMGLWLTPDQEGQHLFEHGEYAAAAKVFHDPMWQGVAWFRAGEFKKAAAAFSRRETPEACFNQGNALVMTGSYPQAISAYETALAKRPHWKEAEDNRALAEARQKLRAGQGGDLGDQREGADEVVFDRNQKDSKGQNTQIAGDQMSGQQAMQSLWLRKVRTKPADFLKIKFAYQNEEDAKK